LGEGKLQSKYEKIAESYLLTDKVFFLGFKENIYNYMRKAKFLVL
jgi:glycosyltransferase involved in cell wall biosynthesis